MITDLAVVGVGAFLVLVALIWKAYRVIDQRLDEIQADIRELHCSASHLFVLASTNAKASDPKPRVASDNSANAPHETDDLAFLRSPGLEADLTEVDELCAKLITLVPPAKAAALISAVPQAKAVPPISEMNAERPAQFGGRRLLLAWPTRGPDRSQG